MKSLEKIGERLIPAVAYGDAAGLPVETKTRDEIAEKYGTIDRLIPTHANPFFQESLGRGTWSDDTQLTLVVANSFLRAGAFDMRAIADGHVNAYHDTPELVRPDGRKTKRGWGGSTVNSVRRFMESGDFGTSGERGGTGNGVIMKMAPLAFWLIARDYDRNAAYDISDKFTSFTHDNKISRVSSRVHLDTLWHLLITDYDEKSFAQAVMSSAERHEAELDETSYANSTALEYLARGVDDTKDILENTDGKGFYVPQTLAMAYGAFMAHDGHFTDSVYGAVNLGGDTDSTASIVATMANIKNGGAFDTPSDFEYTHDYHRLSEISEKLTRLAVNSI